MEINYWLVSVFLEVPQMFIACTVACSVFIVNIWFCTLRVLTLESNKIWTSLMKLHTIWIPWIVSKTRLFLYTILEFSILTSIKWVLWHTYLILFSFVRIATCRQMQLQGFVLYLLSPILCPVRARHCSLQSILLNVADSCYLYFYVFSPLSISGALSRSLMPSLMSKCWVDSAKTQWETIITAYVLREKDL